MYLEHILQAHGLIGKKSGSKTTLLPELINFTAISKNDGSGIDLSWQNSSVIEYVRTEIYASLENIQNADYEYCVNNANLMVSSNVETAYTATGYQVGDVVYFKGFMVLNTLGELKTNKGIGVFATVVDAAPPSPVTEVVAKGDDKFVLLTWVNPLDSDFDKVKAVYKQGAYPATILDGVVGYEGSAETATIIGLTNDIEYYFRFFTYDTNGNINNSVETQQIIAIPTEQRIYGVEIDESNTNPSTSIVYTDDAIGLIPASGNNGSFGWGSWESIIKDEFKIRPCVLNNPSGTVNYYLTYDDYTKKEDNSSSVLTGADGDVMVEFSQPLWWKFTRVANKLKIQLSSKEFDGAIKPAFEIEDGYNQVPIYPLFLTQIIYLLMFKNLDSQTALGRGNSDGSVNYLNTGGTNSKSFNYGETIGNLQMKFLGMEDYWGNRRWWIDGCFYDASRNILIGKGGFNDTGSGYQNFGRASTSDLSGYISKVQGNNNTGFIPATVSGSATTYYCDYGTLFGGRFPIFGGSSGNGANVGGFSLASSAASSASASIGGRLFYSKPGKIYIGAYLGVSQSNKLRSISGQVSANTLTIGAIRTLAKANN